MRENKKLNKIKIFLPKTKETRTTSQKTKIHRIRPGVSPETKTNNEKNE
jgi:hypothetical protein